MGELASKVTAALSGNRSDQTPLYIQSLRGLCYALSSEVVVFTINRKF